MHFLKRLVQSELISKILTISELWDILYIEVDVFYERSAVARGTLASISILFVSEIFALGQMWNNFLRKLWNRKLTLSVKWNKSIRRKAYFTLRSNISRPKGISQILKGFISLKKPPTLYQSWRFFLVPVAGRILLRNLPCSSTEMPCISVPDFAPLALKR